MRHIFPDVPINAGAFEPLHRSSGRRAPSSTRTIRARSRAARPRSRSASPRPCSWRWCRRIPDKVTAAPAGSSGNFALGGFDPGEGRAATSCTRSPAAATAATPTTTGSPTAARPSASPRRRRSRCMEQYYPVLFRRYRAARGLGRRRRAARRLRRALRGRAAARRGARLASSWTTAASARRACSAAATARANVVRVHPRRRDA